jgi:23S rRNA pseudouridine1911/1915/1917 synthase
MQILFEDNHLIVVNKSPGELVQKDKTGDTCLIDLVKDYLKKKYNKPGEVYLGVVHRLDRPTSGIVVFARTSKAAARLSAMFQNREIDKCYWAIVNTKPEVEKQKLIHHLQKNERNNKAIVSTQAKEGFKEARLTFELKASSDHYHLLEVVLETGRHHQIRAQLSAIGSPIKGDLKYGAQRSNPDQSISLHARKISFKHPVKEEKIEITAPVPNEKLWTFFESSLSN